jgi:uncharacterized protein YciI
MPPTSLFLYKIQSARAEMLSEGSTADEKAVIAEHFAYLDGLTRSGTVHLAGRTLTTDYASFGIVIFSAASEEVARAVVRDDPAVRARVMRAELYPFRIALLGELSVSDDTE